MAIPAKVFHELQGLLYHGGAVVYAVLAYGFELSDRWEEAKTIRRWVQAMWAAPQVHAP